MKEFIVKDHAPSWLPEGNWEMVWAEEFDGTELDRSKWDYRHSMMQQPWLAWTDKGVHLDGKSNAVFTLQEKDGRIVSSQLQTGYNYMDQPLEETKFCNDHLQWTVGKLKECMYTHGPGYYECYCRLQQMNGWWSAFWIQSPNIGSTPYPADSGVEIDVMESFRPGRIAAHNVFTGGYGLDSKRVKVGGTMVDETQWHRFGLLWDETGYTFYIDGVEDGKITEFLTARPEFILISTEVRGYRKEGRTAVPEAREAFEAGDTFLVDHIRVFEKREL